MKMYARSKCMDSRQCFIMGGYAAQQFVLLHNMENREHEIQ